MTLPANPVFITLGSNIDPADNLPRAAARLADQLDVRAASAIYETPPINAAGLIDNSQPTFLNAALLVQTEIPVVRLKFDVLRPIEAELGRVRGLDKFMPRTIDLDIAFYSDLVLRGPGLPVTVPDPDTLTHAHLALPLADLAPDFPHPLTGERLDAVAARLAPSALIRRRDDLALLPPAR